MFGGARGGPKYRVTCCDQTARRPVPTGCCVGRGCDGSGQSGQQQERHAPCAARGPSPRMTPRTRNAPHRPLRAHV